MGEDNEKLEQAWRSFEEACEFARSLGLKNRAAWVAYCKSGQKPDDIPATPYGVYKGKGRRSWEVRRRLKRNLAAVACYTVCLVCACASCGRAHSEGSWVAYVWYARAVLSGVRGCAVL